jgi:hypothetical protein
MTNDNKFLTQMSTDIEEARNKSTFSIESMLYLLRGGKEAVNQMNEIRALAESEPVFSKADTPFQSRQEVILLLFVNKCICVLTFLSTSNYITHCLFQSV